MERIEISIASFFKGYVKFQTDNPLVRAIYPARGVCGSQRVCAPRNSHYGELFSCEFVGIQDFDEKLADAAAQVQEAPKTKPWSVMGDVKMEGFGMLHTWWVFEEKRFVFGKILIDIYI